MKKLLIIEDNQMMKTFLANYFDSSYMVEHVSTPSEALARLNAGDREFDAVISDYKEPSNSEYTRLKEMTSRIKSMNIPSVILTDDDKSEQRLLSLSLGANDALSKPFNPKELNLRVSSLVEQYAVSTPIMRKAA